ncbi:DUF599 family protein [Azospirillum sp. RWY-5-1]|uniref:DUF599 family protein n=1 Tax=Azospirillum oleiclasticum TaxID=2735135 RepID=A0ABX2TFS3_9PROT|nr:DUF599 family protein [Azospirillum oleiclasticum]NYZ22013.1 DUF599 family protein [Azospirillum oleiclasticum]
MATTPTPGHRPLGHRPVPTDLIAPDATPLDLFALCWFAGLWGVYTLIQDQVLRGRRGINQHLVVIRRHWIDRMLERDNRIMDSQLVGHTMSSATFFASTTMLILAGLIGSFGAIDTAHEIISHLSIMAKTSRDFFEVKMALLVAIFIYIFFKFTWSLRQFNYTIALIGSAPMPPVEGEIRRVTSETISGSLTLAILAFNGGLRGYYFALAALAWMIGPVALILATAGVLVVLVRRQGFSRSERLISRQTDLLEELPKPWGPDGR